MLFIVIQYHSQETNNKNLFFKQIPEKSLLAVSNVKIIPYHLGTFCVIMDPIKHQNLKSK